MDCTPAKPKRKNKEFIFTDHIRDESWIIKIPEVLDPNYGMYVWPSSVVLAQYIWYHRAAVKNKRILEIGAGTALPGVLAASLGANVILSDASHLPDCLENCNQSCLANGVKNKVQVIGMSWGQFDPSLLKLGPVDLIVASDCFYDTKDFEDIVMTISYILNKNPGCEFWTTYQERSSERTLEQLLQKWNLQCIDVPLYNFEANSCDIAQSSLPGHHSIQMLILKLKL